MGIWHIFEIKGEGRVDTMVQREGVGLEMRGY